MTNVMVPYSTWSLQVTLGTYMCGTTHVITLVTRPVTSYTTHIPTHVLLHGDLTSLVVCKCPQIGPKEMLPCTSTNVYVVRIPGGVPSRHLVNVLSVRPRTMIDSLRMLNVLVYVTQTCETRGLDKTVMLKADSNSAKEYTQWHNVT
jgi:hypothetical protein